MPKRMIITSIVSLTLVTVGVHLWAMAMVTPQPDVLLAAEMLDTATGVVWIMWLMGRAVARVIARIDSVERAHSVRIYSDAVAVPDAGRPRLRGLS